MIEESTKISPTRTHQMLETCSTTPSLRWAMWSEDTLMEPDKSTICSACEILSIPDLEHKTNTGAAIMISCGPCSKKERKPYKPVTPKPKPNASKLPEPNPKVQKQDQPKQEQDKGPPNEIEEKAPGLFYITNCNEKYLNSEEGKTFFNNQGFKPRDVQARVVTSVWWVSPT